MELDVVADAEVGVDVKSISDLVAFLGVVTVVIGFLVPPSGRY